MLHILLTGFVFLVILTVLVILHEAGHYLTARLFNIKVEEFGFGFPPRAWGKKVGETLYSINWLPIGGFVKLFGEDEAGGGKVSLPSSVAKKTPASGDEARAFFARPAWQRALVVFAGVVMNTILAFIIFYAFLGISHFKTDVVLLGDLPHLVGVNATKHTLISDVEPNSPAAKSGMTGGGIIDSVNGKAIGSADAFINAINSQKGKLVSITWHDATSGDVHTIRVVPRIHPPKGQGSLGVALGDAATLSYDTPVQKIFSGISHSANMLIYTFATFGSLIQTSVKTHSVGPISEGFSGPVGIAAVVSTILDLHTIREKVLMLLNLAGLLSISLAFFNVLPIPALDGGRLFFIIIEMVTRRKLNPKFEAYANNIGMAVLLGLILIITLKDIRQFIFHQ